MTRHLPPPKIRVDGMSIRSVASAIPDFAIALLFLTTWFAPLLFDMKMVTSLKLTMLLEFIIIHSAAMTAGILVSARPLLQRALHFLFFGVVYSLFVGGFAYVSGVWWPLTAFWLLMLNRMATLLPGGRRSDSDDVTGRWTTSFLLFLAFAFLTAIVPLPRFGISEAVIAAQEFTGSGVWVEQPQSVIAFGFLYFAAIGAMELAGVRLTFPEAPELQSRPNVNGSES
jgi:hypothetical protein